MFVILITIVGVVGAAWALTGSLSLRKRDQYSVDHPFEDARASQIMDQMHNNQHNGF